MNIPNRDDFEYEEECEEAEEQFRDYCDAKIEEAKEDRFNLRLINDNTVKVLQELNEELESEK